MFEGFRRCWVGLVSSWVKWRKSFCYTLECVCVASRFTPRICARCLCLYFVCLLVFDNRLKGDDSRRTGVEVWKTGTHEMCAPRERRYKRAHIAAAAGGWRDGVCCGLVWCGIQQKRKSVIYWRIMRDNNRRNDPRTISCDKPTRKCAP